MFEHGLRGYCHWTDYFDKYGIKEPDAISHNPFTLGWGHPEMTVWQVVDLDERRARNFAAGMKSGATISAKHGGPASIYDFSWLGEEALVGKNTEQPLLIDVGGSHGNTLKHIMAEVPTIPQNRCILQDRPEVIEEAIQVNDPALAGVTKLPHDFNAEQPVKGRVNFVIA
jgi:hypothetical protein